jgi:hypothetical protein
VSNWDNDTAPNPVQPVYGADDLSDDDGSWLDPVSYDQTEYQDLDAYLAHDGQPGPDWAPEPTGSLDDTTVDGTSLDGLSLGGPSLEGTAAGGAPGDDYAGYDEYAYLGSYQAPADFPDGEAWPGQPQPEERWTPPAAAPDEASRPYGQPRQQSARRRPRWVTAGITAVVAAALGAGVIIVTHSRNSSLPSSALPLGTTSPGGGAPVLIRPSAPASAGTAAPGGTGGAAAGATGPGALAAPLTQPQAQQVLTAYTTANNTANAQASQSVLATVETGSSLAIDSGSYQRAKAAGSAAYPAFSPVRATYFIPLESPAAYPHWFAVHVKNAFLSAPGKVINGEYLVFTQASPGAPWLERLEPFVVNPGAEPAIALDANGYATAVTPNDANLVLSPAAASGATATAFDSGGQPATPGTLAAGQEEEAVRPQVPAGTTTAIRHAGTSGPVVGLRTADGGALLFYDIGATLTVTAPAGSTLSRLNVPGFVAPGGQATSVTLDFLEQFATYDPARGHGTGLPIVADYSGITGQG